MIIIILYFWGGKKEASGIMSELVKEFRILKI